MRLSVLTVIALTLAVSAIIAAKPQLFAVEISIIKSSGLKCTDYLLIPCENTCELTIKVNESIKNLIVRVDSSTPFKPYMVFFDNFRVTPKLDDGVILIEDFVWINFTFKNTRPRSVKVEFRLGEAKPFLYALAEQGEKIWGYLIEALIKDSSVLSEIGGSKATILAVKPLHLSTSVGEFTLWDLTLLVTGDSPTRILNILNKTAMETRINPIYFNSLNEKRSTTRYLYLNIPASCSISIERGEKAGDLIGKAFPENPVLLTPSSIISNRNICYVNLTYEGPYKYAVGSQTLTSRSYATLAIRPEEGSIVATAYRKGVMVYDLVIHGFAPLVKLPTYSYNVYVEVVDSKGNLALNATVFLIGARNALRETAKVAENCYVFEDVPPGDYIVSVLMRGKEVGRKQIKVESSDESFIVNTSLVEVEVSIIYHNGEKVLGYTFILKDKDGIEYIAKEVGGFVRVKSVPSGVYNYTAIKNGVVISEGQLDVGIDSSSHVIVTKASKVYVKVLDFFGRPVPNIPVNVHGQVSTSSITRNDGVAVFDLMPGEYFLEVTELSLKSKLHVVNGGEYIVLSSRPPTSVILIACLVGMLVVILPLVSRKRNAVEVLDVDDEE
ncbi:MAG: carboxypeptidase-like regulatory domain-containing protein [Thermofilaceae archaeon]|nr:carboxypeptidase-like regulatory domain-containing protein [Thermofilaceae archaeon]